MHCLRPLKWKIFLYCFVYMLVLMGGTLAILYAYQRSIMVKMEERTSEIFRGLQIQFFNLEPDASAEAMLRNQLSVLKKERGFDSVVLPGSPKTNVSVANTGADTKPLLEFGTPEQPKFVNVSPREGEIIMAYFQSFPLLADTQSIGSVGIALAIAPQISLVQAIDVKFVAALLSLFLITTAALCCSLIRLLRPIPMMTKNPHGEESIPPAC
jgi:hypothetical protein